MNRKNLVIASIALAFLLPVTPTAFLDAPPAGQKPVLGQGSLASLQASYAKWRAAYEQAGGSAQTLRLPLAHSPGLADIASRARGVFDFNLMDGSVKVNVQGLEAGAYEVWLVDNQPGGTVKLEPADKLLRLGELAQQGGKASLAVNVQPAQLQGFTLDSVAVTRKGEPPAQSVALVGAPGLMQQWYYAEQFWPVAKLGGALSAENNPPSAFESLLPKPAHAAANAAATADMLSAQIALGRRLFLTETFGGNGRTCATCHRQENNFTLDPKFIATLPPGDPLFVAETNPNLANLENPKLLRQLGLILANVDGFDKPGVLRSVPHLLALNASITTELMTMGGDFPQDSNFFHALGWSGDGAPGSGSLREFSIGAVKQHMPKTLNRADGVDFRLPTDEELDALEAFQLSLGRAKDYNLAQLSFNSPVVERGKALFDTKQNPVVNGQVVQGQSANCNGCHQNAGALSSTTHANPTRDTGVENMGDQSARLLYPDLPVDGGFGQLPRSNCGPKHDQNCFGDGRFNTTTVIEAADTAPYFHNNSVSTLEEAVAAYNGDGFNNSPGSLTSKGADRRIKLGSTQVVAVALFLRAINAVENIRNGNQLDRQAMGLTGASSQEVLRLAMYETRDAIRVLEEGVLMPYPEAVAKLKEALKLETQAYAVPSALRNQIIQAAIARKREAVNLMLTCNPNAPTPSTSTSPMFTCGEIG